MFVEVTVGLKDLIRIQREMNGIDVTTKCALILRDKNTGTAIPMWISSWEHSQICNGIEPEDATGVPQPHDLYTNSLTLLGAKVERVEIPRLLGNHFCAIIHLKDKDDNSKEIEANAPDAVAIAVRLKIPIFVDRNLFLQVFESEGAKEFLESVDQCLRQLED